MSDGGAAGAGLGLCPGGGKAPGTLRGWGCGGPGEAGCCFGHTNTSCTWDWPVTDQEQACRFQLLSVATRVRYPGSTREPVIWEGARRLESPEGLSNSTHPQNKINNTNGLGIPCRAGNGRVDGRRTVRRRWKGWRSYSVREAKLGLNAVWGWARSDLDSVLWKIPEIQQSTSNTISFLTGQHISTLPGIM